MCYTCGVVKRGDTMPYKRNSNSTENAIAARKKWDAENLRKFSVAMRTEEYEKAKAIADREEKSFNRFVVECIEKRLQEEE